MLLSNTCSAELKAIASLANRARNCPIWRSRARARTGFGLLKKSRMDFFDHDAGTAA
jgi:hypothetical protein